MKAGFRIMNNKKPRLPDVTFDGSGFCFERKNTMPFEVVRNDITLMEVDAIVNAANMRLRAGGGVCGAIFARAGREKLQAACDEIGYCGEGEAVITPGFNLPARHVIHTPGPVWQGGNNGEEELLKNCYINSMQLAHERGLKSIAFPLISSGIFGYPREEAVKVAISTIQGFLMETDMQVYLVVFDEETFNTAKNVLQSV